MEKVEWNSIDKKQNLLKYSKNEIIRPPPGLTHTKLFFVVL